MKYFLLCILLFSLNTLRAQVLSFHHGEVEFYTASILSDIDAISENVEIELDIQTGNVELTLDVNSFEFEYDIMKEHFEEKYMETDKFPQASFKGKIIQDISKNFTVMNVDASGKLSIHGVTREIEFKVNISKKDNFMIIKSKVPIAFKDYNIDEPSILTKSVAKDVEVLSTLYLK